MRNLGARSAMSNPTLLARASFFHLSWFLRGFGSCVYVCVRCARPEVHTARFVCARAGFRRGLYCETTARVLLIFYLVSLISTRAVLSPHARVVYCSMDWSVYIYIGSGEWSALDCIRYIVPSEMIWIREVVAFVYDSLHGERDLIDIKSKFPMVVWYFSDRIERNLKNMDF